MGVTKTDFMRGMQCPKMLWLDKHKPEEKIIPQEVQARLDKGNEFGDSAMGMFGDYIDDDDTFGCTCDHCGAEFFLNSDDLESDEPLFCPFCNTEIELAFNDCDMNCDSCSGCDE